MQNWRLDVSEEAARDLARLDTAVRRRIVKRLEWLENSFDTITPTPLMGEFKGLYKFRAGDWRIFYSVDWERNRITVHYIGHRSRAYKRR